MFQNQDLFSSEYKLDANGPVLAEMPTANQMPAELHDEYLRDRGDSRLVGIEGSKVGVGDSGKTPDGTPGSTLPLDSCLDPVTQAPLIPRKPVGIS